MRHSCFSINTTHTATDGPILLKISNTEKIPYFDIEIKKK